MKLYKIEIEHNDTHLFYKFEINWISAKNLKDAEKKCKKLMKLKKRFAVGKKFFMKEIPKIKNITILEEIKPN